KKESKEEILRKYDFGSEYEINEVFDYFINPNALEVKEKAAQVGFDKDKLIEFMSSKHSFDADRISSYLEKFSRHDVSLFNYG
ncbi:MAG: hypothetical protein M1348_00465, partial [Candidatus Parvarchaeota archaeon]|nr:hypothetical protein [Candidatus Parvarchaeota archaeon]